MVLISIKVQIAGTNGKWGDKPYYHRGDQVDVPEERAHMLVSANVAEYVKVQKPEKEAPAPEPEKKEMSADEALPPETPEVIPEPSPEPEPQKPAKKSRR